MREIKFRAWDDHDKVMRKVRSLSYNSSNDIGYTTGVDIGMLGNSFHILMQYTGLKDKNGVEIYEGDVLNRLHQGFGVVEYVGCSYTRRVKTPKGYRNYHLSPEDSALLSVAGNIHENPELLEQK